MSQLKDLLLRTSNTNIREYCEDLIEVFKTDSKNNSAVESLLKDLEALILSDYASEIDPDNLYIDGWGSNEDGDNELRDLFREKIFDYPKPSRLIEKLIASTRIQKGIVLDFFAGSGTTAHAVMKLNKKGKCIQHILCTNNEIGKKKENEFKKKYDLNADEFSKWRFENRKQWLEYSENNGICTSICYPRIKKVIEGYKNRNNENVTALGGNLKYFKTSFVPSEPTDKNKVLLTKEAVSMLCLRENTFDVVSESDTIKIFENKDRYTGILFDQLEIPKFKKEASKFKKPVSVYVFSLGDDDFAEEFTDLKKVKVCSIPEAILRVYRRIFK